MTCKLILKSPIILGELINLLINLFKKTLKRDSRTKPINLKSPKFKLITLKSTGFQGRKIFSPGCLSNACDEKTQKVQCMIYS